MIRYLAKPSALISKSFVLGCFFRICAAVIGEFQTQADRFDGDALPAVEVMCLVGGGSCSVEALDCPLFFKGSVLRLSGSSGAR